MVPATRNTVAIRTYRGSKGTGSRLFVALSSLPLQPAFVHRGLGAVARNYSNEQTMQATGGRSADCPPTTNGSGQLASWACETTFRCGFGRHTQGDRSTL